MDTMEIPQLTYRGNSLEQAPECFDTLKRADEALNDRDELHRRMEQDGYLYLPGLLDCDQVLAARAEVMDRLYGAGMLDKDRPAIEGVVAPKAQYDGASTGPFMPQLTVDNQSLHTLLYTGAMLEFYEFFLGGAVRHYDYTWFRAKKPGLNTVTTPHCDIVYMGRGTKNLYTSWTPLGDVPYEMGGLLVLEDSHRLEPLRATYGATDVDKYCENDPGAADMVEAARSEGRELTDEERNQLRWNSSGAYSSDAIDARRQLGGRWLTAQYEMGDLLVLSMYTMHASSDNQTDRIRISSDSRYQLAAEVIDDRWIGADPPAHGIRAKRGMVC